MSYADITTNDRNALKRWVHRRRFASALSLSEPGHTALDFGGGNGELCKGLCERFQRVICYEPILLDEARLNLDKFPVKLAKDLSTVPSKSVDAVFCLEVLEHLKDTHKACRQIVSLLKPDGYVVIGIPIEIGLPALFKGIFRMTRRLGDHDANLRNVLLATLGTPPTERPINGTYFPHHLGFDHRRLIKTLAEYFVIEKTLCSPFHAFGSWANSEMYFLVKPR